MTKKAKQSGTRKIGDVGDLKICFHTEHKPPSHQVFEPGIYEHICPGCGEVTRFHVLPKWA